MSLSNELAEILADAERSLSPPDYDLALAWRDRIWKALGPFDRNASILGEGHVRRGRLGILAAERVLPIWDRLLPGDDRPRRVLDSAKRVLETGIEDDWPAELLHFDVALDKLRVKHHDRVELMAGYAALAAYRVAVDDQELDPDRVAEPRYYDAPDPARDAAYAVADAPEFPASDPARRREFWTWWLREAVPTAAAFV